MNRSFLSLLQTVVLSASLWLFVDVAEATVDGWGDEFCFQAIEPYIKQGYTLREDTWGGDLAVGETKVVTCQLFKGNQYVFAAGSENRGSKISVHIYDEDGALVESKSWQQSVKDGSTAGAKIEARRTGNYRIVVKVEAGSDERVGWGMMYGYK